MQRDIFPFCKKCLRTVNQLKASFLWSNTIAGKMAIFCDLSLEPLLQERGCILSNKYLTHMYKEINDRMKYLYLLYYKYTWYIVSV